MKKIFRALFFLDEPVRGAFWGMSILLVLLALGVNLGVLTLLVCSFDEKSYYIFAWALLWCLLLPYVGFLCVNGGQALNRQSGISRKDSAILALVAICVGAVAGLAWNYFLGESESADGAWGVFLFAFLLVGIVGSALQRRRVIPLGSDLLCWAMVLAGVVGLWLIIVAVVEMFVQTGLKPHYVVLGTFSANGWIVVLTMSILLLAGAYLLQGYLLAHSQGVSLRRFCGRSLFCFWGVVLGSYVLACALGMSAQTEYRRTVRELEAHFGRPLTASALEGVYYEGRTRKPEFWEEFSEKFHELEKDINKFGNLVRFPKCEMGPEWKELWRTKVLDSENLRRLEEMLDAGLPPAERDYEGGRPIDDMLLPELHMLQVMTHLQRWHLQDAIEARGFDTAERLLRRMEKISTFLEKDCFAISLLVAYRTESAGCMEAITRLAASGLASEEWLRRQAEQLEVDENKQPELERRMLYADLVGLLDDFRCFGDGRITSITSDSEQEMSCVPLWPLRWLLPCVWWRGTRSAQKFLDACRVGRLDELPMEAKDAVWRFCMQDLHLPSANRHRRRLAAYRAVRELIAAELIRRRTGDYPESLPESLPDPFASGSLKYRFGWMEAKTPVWKSGDWEGLDDESRRELEADDSVEYGRVELRTTRQVEAVKVWSVGPDGRDRTPLDSLESEEDEIIFLLEK